MPNRDHLAQTSYEALFHSSSLQLIIPETSAFPPEHDDLSAWWNDVESTLCRDTAYFDEKLFYLVSMTLPEPVPSQLQHPSGSASEPSSELLRFLSRLQPTMTASFVPAMASLRARESTITSLESSASASSLAPPTVSGVATSRPPGAGPSSGNDQARGLPPTTPNPFPTMARGEEQYAHVDGVVVWEGPVEDAAGPWEDNEGKGKGGGGGRKVIKTEHGWEVVWRGQVPIAYVRTQIQNPLLALTASVTLREAGQPRHRRGAESIDNMSIRSGTTIRTDGTGYDDEPEEDETFAGMQEIDLLGGLVGDSGVMPAARLAPSLRHDLSLPSGPLPSAMPLSALTPTALPSIANITSLSNGPSRETGQIAHSIATVPSTTLRKSYRRVLSLAPGLRVRMRTLFLPQLLPPSGGPSGRSTSHEDDREGACEKRIVLCVEVENSVEPSLLNGFEVEQVNVEVGGKGGQASTELVCQPTDTAFPLRLGSTEQCNLLYAVEIASASERDRDGYSNGIEEAVAKSLGRGDEQRPVSITVIGRPFYRAQAGSEVSPGDPVYPTLAFHSRWNCTLDLAPFYATAAHLAPPVPKGARDSKVLLSPPNAFAGDKRYSLAHLLSVERDRESISQGPSRRGPLLPSQAINPPGGRITSGARLVDKDSGGDNYGLLVSIKLLPGTDHGSGSQSSGTVAPMEPFSIEVFVHNQTDQVRRFRLAVPAREAGAEGKIREVWERRRRRRADEPDWGMEDPVLKASLGHHLSTATALIPLENDVRCGPLLPGASLSARLRFLALREGVHKVEGLRFIGVGDNVDYTISPVLDIVVTPRDGPSR
ncbi:hypothetical protein IAU60_005289 [Kwoniella sp. DSM 27419]